MSKIFLRSRCSPSDSSACIQYLSAQIQVQTLVSASQIPANVHSDRQCCWIKHVAPSGTHMGAPEQIPASQLEPSPAVGQKDGIEGR